MTRARIIFTWDCNRACSYCCNKVPAVRDSFRPITAADLLKTDFDEYAITGGEPLLHIERLFRLAKLLRSARPHAKIHLYTNGDMLTGLMCRIYPWPLFDGVNIGIHQMPSSMNFRLFYTLNDFVPVRLLVPANLAHHFTASDFAIKTWRLNDCLDMPEEPRFYLQENL